MTIYRIYTTIHSNTHAHNIIYLCSDHTHTHIVITIFNMPSHTNARTKPKHVIQFHSHTFYARSTNAINVYKPQFGRSRTHTHTPSTPYKLKHTPDRTIFARVGMPHAKCRTLRAFLGTPSSPFHIRKNSAHLHPPFLFPLCFHLVSGG